MERSHPNVITTRAIEGSEALDKRLEPAVEALRRGELVAFPTETVYGLGADAMNRSAVERIFSAKERPPGHPLIVHVADEHQAREAAAAWPDAAELLAEAFWPGPMTMVLPRDPQVPDEVTGGLSTIGIRMPNHPVALALVRAAAVPVAAPSANIHQRISPTRAEHVLESLGDRIEVLVDGGPSEVGVESTVVRVAEQEVEILRPGMISTEAIAEVLENADGTWRVSEESAQPAPEPEAPRASPGMADRHYAPEGCVRLMNRSALIEQLQGLEEPARVALATFGDLSEEMLVDELAAVELLPEKAPGCARELYAALHRLDEADSQEIWIESPPSGEDWRVIRDRLRRASR